MPRFVRRGRASGRPRNLDEDSDDDAFQMASDVEEEQGELRQWLEGPGHNAVWTLLSPARLVVRWLPPGNVKDLYTEYVATQSLIGTSVVSYHTFWRLWRCRWHNFLHFRAKTLPSPQLAVSTLNCQCELAPPLHTSPGLGGACGTLHSKVQPVRCVLDTAS